MINSLMGSFVRPVLVGTMLYAGAAFAADDRAVIISHGDTAITVFDVKQAVNSQVPRDRQVQMYGNEKKLREFIGSMFVQAKLAEMASKRELTPEEQWRVDEVVRRVLSQIEVEREVAARANEADLEVLAREVYLASPDRFKEPAAVRAAHILISTEKRSEEEALALAKQVRAEAVAGKAFDELATQYSEDRSVERNKGDLGFFTTGRMVKPFEDAVFAMTESGQISEPVKTQFGYHVIRFIERRDERIRSFDEVRQVLINEERGRYRTQIANELIDRIANLEGMKVDPDALESLVQRPAAVTGAPAPVAR